MNSGAFAGFVLDMGHAVYAANALNEGALSFLKRFLQFNPRMMHIADGVWNRIGQGDFELAAMCALLPGQARLTLEIPRDAARQLQDAKEDALALRRLFLAAP